MAEPALRDDLRKACQMLEEARRRALRENVSTVVDALDHAIPWTKTARKQAYYHELENTAE